jgi:drug/metabolite transporter (DMT)-like permease
MISRAHNKLKAIAFITVAVGLATSQDAIVKYLTGTFPAYETVAFRGFASMPFLLLWQLRTVGWRAIKTPLLGLIFLRSTILCMAYFSFVLAIAVMPMANAVAIYFTMPFFLAAMVGKALGEHVPLYRWLAILVGFSGVLIALQPGAASFQPASIFALVSAFGYALGQMLSRHIAQHVQPIIIATWQNLFYIAASILIGIVVYNLHMSVDFMPSLTKPLAWPHQNEIKILVGLGLLSAISTMGFISAYQNAEANFVAPFEYSAMIWAVLFGVLLFGDFPTINTLAGAAIIISAGLFMLLMDHAKSRRLAPVPR